VSDSPQDSSQPTPETTPGADTIAHDLERILTSLDDWILGEQATTRTLLAAFAAGGHVLIEGAPGLGKTLLARCFASCLGAGFARIQFTPDLMPSDVTGVNVFDPAMRSFSLSRGPIFTQILMADEINRTPPKTQAALLEAMQESQVTIDGTAHALDPCFFVIATQNPVEFEGTYPLPEAQLDRFLARIEIGLPDADAEVELLRRAAAGRLAGWSNQTLPEVCISTQQVAALRRASRSVHAAEEVLMYLQRLAQTVRLSPHVDLGISPRGLLSLLELARAWALLEGRTFVTPDDIKHSLVPCWAHRLLLTPESELEGLTARGILEAAADSVEVPH